MQVGRFEFFPGMQSLLQQLNESGHEMHAVSNYPIWFRWIEDKLQLSQYMPWTFVSCEGPIKVRFCHQPGPGNWFPLERAG